MLPRRFAAGIRPAPPFRAPDWREAPVASQPARITPAGISDSLICPYLPVGMLDVEVARREAQRVSSTRVQLRSLSQTPTVAELSRSLHLTQDEVGALPLPAAACD